MAESVLIGLEEQGWQALSATPQAATEFYDRVLDHTVVMLLPGGVVLTERAAIIHSMSYAPWSSYRLEEPRVLHPTENTAVVTYGVVARREGASTYSALMSSMYVHRADGWKMVFHQQTPR